MKVGTKLEKDNKKASPQGRIRRGEGFTSMRYIDLIYLPDLLGGRERDYFLARAFFLEVIDTLPARQWRESLLVAFGLASVYAGLANVRERREKYGQQAGRKYDTLRSWEDAALEQLATMLFKGRRAPSCDNTSLDLFR
jgi:hypothetical protein